MSVKIDKRLAPLRAKAIAVGSGKGGVGKTVTAVNLAIHFAHRGLKVALVDLDPLSNVVTLLGIEEPEEATKHRGYGEIQQDLNAYRLKLFSNLDLFFPWAKLEKLDIELIKRMLFERYRAALIKAYDVLVFDMPAGNRFEDNISFLPYVKDLILVTASEPTAHVSAGGYIRLVQQMKTKPRINVWHNRFTPQTGEFDPKDLIGNYNRNVPRRERIEARKVKRLRDLAFVPHDVSMDLLEGRPSLVVNVQRSMLDLLGIIHGQRIGRLLGGPSPKAKAFEFMRFFLTHNRKIGEVSDYLEDLEDFLERVTPKGHDGGHRREGRVAHFTDQNRGSLTLLLERIKEDKLREFVVSLIDQLERSIERLEESKRPFSVGERIGSEKQLDRKLSRLLVYLNHRVDDNEPFLRNIACVLVFYFALSKFLKAKTVMGVMAALIPVKRNRQGRMVRNRFLQIKSIVERHRGYRQRYIASIKTLFPALYRQIVSVSQTFELNNLVLEDRNGGPNREAYLKLFNNFMYEAVNSGLGIVVGFRYRPAAIAFSEAADRILEEMKGPAR
jgi:flagellar biosynthesis protein FlhG